MATGELTGEVELAVLDADFFAPAFFAFAAAAFLLAAAAAAFLLAAAARARDALVLRRGAAVFQPLALSALNDAGMAMARDGSSVTEAAAASAKSARTSEMTFDGRRAFAACTRFVSSTTNISRFGSIQRDVPV